MWDAYSCHTSTAVRAETARLRLHTAIVPGGCTKFIQAADVVWNAGFKSLYDAWCADPGGHQYTRGVKLKHPSRALLCQWRGTVKSSWEAVPTQCSNGGRFFHHTYHHHHHHIHCFKAGQPCATGKSRLDEEIWKL